MEQRAVARFALAGLAAFLLSGCIKVDLDLTVSPDNTASGTATMAIDKQLLRLSGAGVDDFLRESNFTAPGSADDSSTAPYEDGTFVGRTVTFRGASLSDVNGSGGDGDLRIVRQGDEFRVTGVLDLSIPTDATNGDPQVDAMTKRALRTADIRIELTFPGRVISSNGAVEGNSVTWRPKLGESTELRAVASAVPSSSSSSPWWIAIVAGVLLVVAAAVVIGTRRRPAEPSEPPVPPQAPDEP
jgi:hypothetical protein